MALINRPGSVSMRKLLEDAGLSNLLDPSMMTEHELRKIEDATERALVVQAARMTARLEDPDLTPAELANITMALSRVKAILDRHRGTSGVARASRQIAEQTQSAKEAELERLEALEAKFGSGDLFSIGE